MEANKELSPIVTNLFLTGRKLNISYVFISKLYSKVSKTIRLNTALNFIMKMPNKKEAQQIAPNHWAGIEFKNLMKLCRDYTKEPFSFLVDDTTLLSDNRLRITKNLL